MHDKAHAIFVCTPHGAHMYCNIAQTFTGVLFIYLVIIAAVAGLIGAAVAVGRS